MKITPKEGLCLGRVFEAVQFVKTRKNGLNPETQRHICIYSEESKWINQAKVDEYLREYESGKERIVEVKLPNGIWKKVNPSDWIIMYDTFLYGKLTASEEKTLYRKVNDDTQLKNKLTKVGI